MSKIRHPDWKYLMQRILLLVITLCILSACDADMRVEVISPSRAAPSQSGGNLSVQSPPMPRGLPQASVDRVIDGDTVDVNLNGQIERIRLIGINTPESVDPRRPVECFGKEAAKRAKELLNGKTVYLESDDSQGTRDQFGRALRYIWLDNGQMFNLLMIAEGYAYEYTYDLPYKYQVEFKAAHRDASRNDIGLWSPRTCNGRR